MTYRSAHLSPLDKSEDTVCILGEAWGSGPVWRSAGTSMTVPAEQPVGPVYVITTDPGRTGVPGCRTGRSPRKLA
jgi:hypothetical protein